MTVSVAAKAWKAAQSSAIKSAPAKTNTNKKGAKFDCYWCCSTTHFGRHCPLKRAGKPPNSSARAMSWTKAERDRSAKQKKRMKIEKP